MMKLCPNLFTCFWHFWHLLKFFLKLLNFFVYQHWIWFFGGILSTKGFNANFFNFRMKFFICLMKLCPKFLKTMSSQNIRTVVKIFTPVLATRMHSISLSSQSFKGIVFTQLCYDFHRVCPWLAYNSTMTSNPNTLKFLQQQWLQSLKITQVVPANTNSHLKTEKNRDCNKSY